MNSRLVAAERTPLLKTLILVSLVVAVSYVAARVGQALSFQPGIVSPLWPANAILVSVLLLVPRRIWPILIIVTFATYLRFDLQFAPQCLGAIRQAAQPIAGTDLVRAEAAAIVLDADT